MSSLIQNMDCCSPFSTSIFQCYSAVSSACPLKMVTMLTFFCSPLQMPDMCKACVLYHTLHFCMGLLIFWGAICIITTLLCLPCHITFPTFFSYIRYILLYPLHFYSFCPTQHLVTCHVFLVVVNCFIISVFISSLLIPFMNCSFILWLSLCVPTHFP